MPTWGEILQEVRSAKEGQPPRLDWQSRRKCCPGCVWRV